MTFIENAYKDVALKSSLYNQYSYLLSSISDNKATFGPFQDSLISVKIR